MAEMEKEKQAKAKADKAKADADKAKAKAKAKDKSGDQKSKAPKKEQGSKEKEVKEKTATSKEAKEKEEKEKKADEKEEKAKTEAAKPKKYMPPHITLSRQMSIGFSDKLLGFVDVKLFSSRLLMLVELTALDDDITKVDDAISEHALSLWVALLLYRPSVMAYYYKALKDYNTQPRNNIFFNILFCRNPDGVNLRKLFATAVYQLCLNSNKSMKIPIQKNAPIIYTELSNTTKFFLKLLLDSIPTYQKSYGGRLECGEYFTVLNFILRGIFATTTKPDVVHISVAAPKPPSAPVSKSDTKADTKSDTKADTKSSTKPDTKSSKKEKEEKKKPHPPQQPPQPDPDDSDHDSQPSEQPPPAPPLIPDNETHLAVRTNKEFTQRVDCKTYEWLFKRLVKQLERHKSSERKQSSPTDKVLLGVVEMVTVLLAAHRPFRVFPGASKFISEIFHLFLFKIHKPKCNTTLSRAAAFALLVEFCRDCLKNLYQITNLLIKQRIDVEPMEGWEYNPKKHVKSACGYVGLQNQGSTCYMNSLLQQFFMSTRFRGSILLAKDEALDKKDSLLYQMQNMFGFLCASEKQAFDTSGFCFSYKDYQVMWWLCSIGV